MYKCIVFRAKSPNIHCKTKRKISTTKSSAKQTNKIAQIKFISSDEKASITTSGQSLSKRARSTTTTKKTPV